MRHNSSNYWHFLQKLRSQEVDETQAKKHRLKGFWRRAVPSPHNPKSSENTNIPFELWENTFSSTRAKGNRLKGLCKTSASLTSSHKLWPSISLSLLTLYGHAVYWRPRKEGPKGKLREELLLEKAGREGARQRGERGGKTRVGEKWKGKGGGLEGRRRRQVEKRQKTDQITITNTAIA